MNASMIIHPSELSRAWADKLSSSGIDCLGIHPVGGEGAAESLKALVELCKTAEYRENIDYAHSLGISIEYEMHTAGYLLPRSLFGNHPEYFRMNEAGERVADYNLCVSNEAALDIFSERAAELALSLYGSDSRFYFWMDDGHGLCCHCERCKRLSASDQALIAVNRMAMAVRKHIPDAKMAYLAYMDTVTLPEVIKPGDGVFLEYAPFEKYTAKGDNAAALIEREKRIIAPLIRFFSNEPAKVLEYWYDNSLYSGWRKPPKKFVLNEEKMRADILEYKLLGFDKISTFACYLGDDYCALYGDVDVTAFRECVKE